MAVLPVVKTLFAGSCHAIGLPTDSRAFGRVRPELLQKMQLHQQVLASNVSGLLRLRDYEYALEPQQRSSAGSITAQLLAGTQAMSLDSGEVSIAHGAPLAAPNLQALVWALNMHGFYDARIEQTPLGARLLAEGVTIVLNATETLVDLRQCQSREAADRIYLCLQEALGGIDLTKDGEGLVRSSGK